MSVTTAKAPAIIDLRTRLDQTRTPLADLLEEESPAGARWTVPGHMGGRCAPPRAMELLGERIHRADLWPDQGRYAEALSEAEALAADAWGAAGAHLLTGGATSGNLAWIFASLQAGDTVVVDSACHVSILTGLRLRTGVRPVWVQRQIDPELGIPLPLEPAVIEQALREHPGARQLIVTSPTYSGTGSRLGAIADIAHAAGATLYVDSAWAPHGRWVPDGGLDAIAAGADACVISLHKTGSALSGAAILLTTPSLDTGLQARLRRAVEGVRSTSPLLPVLVSGDLSRATLATAAFDGIVRAADLADDLRARCAAVPGVRPLAGHELDGRGRGVTDPMKLVLDVSGTGHTGFAIQRLLRATGVIVEGADLRRVYLVLPAVTRTAAAHIGAHRALSRGLARAAATAPSRHRHLRLAPSVWAASRGNQALIPSAADGYDHQRVPLAQAAGRIAAEHAAPYPPGVPVWVPGETITVEALAILDDVRSAGGEIHGLSDPTGRTVTVIAR